MKKITPKLPLSEEERNNLRKQKINLIQISEIEPEFLSMIIRIPIERARKLIALATFQRIPSVGPKLAKNLFDLGYYSLDHLKDKDGAKLIEDLEMLYGVWMDPCVEDGMRLIVYYANHPNSNKQWWHFTEERKLYRAKFDYPDTRPKIAWNDPSRKINVK